VQDNQCHVRILFGSLVFDFCAARQAAILYAHDVGQWLGVPVLIDDEVRDDMPPLPCESLWLP
jgi:hypothetical protein